MQIAEHNVDSLNSTVTALVKENSLLSDRLQAFEKEFAQSKV